MAGNCDEVCVGANCQDSGAGGNSGEGQCRKAADRLVQELVTEFTSLVVHVATMHEDDKVFQFCSGLHDDIRRFVNVQRPTTLVAAQRLAVSAEQGVHDSKGAVNPGSSSQRAGGVAEAMDLGMAEQLAALQAENHWLKQ